MASLRDRLTSSRGLIGVLLLMIVVVGLFLLLPPSEEPPAEPPAAPDALAGFHLYRAEAEGLLTWEDTAVSGTVRARYRVSPGGEVEFYDLKVWAEDTQVSIDLAWWQADVKRLRCLRTVNDGPILGSLAGEELTLAPNARFLTSFYDRRSAAGECEGELRAVEGVTPSQLVVTHQPDDDLFALSGTLSPGEGLAPVTLTLLGGYLNRPPAAVMAMAPADGVKPAFTDLCPAESKGTGPNVPANTPEGLSWLLRSESTDPDGVFEAEDGPTKFPRADIAFERWLHWGPDGFEFLGTGRQLGPVLFAAGADHILLLRAVDREGSEDRAICRFHVTEQS